MYRIVFTFFALLVIWLPGLEAQVEFNVKLYPRETQLKQVLGQLEDPTIASAISPANYQLYPFLNQTTRVQALQKGSVDPELGNWYTLQLSGKVPNLLNQLRRSGRFAQVELNRQVALHALNEAQYTPNDDSLASQWYLEYIRAFAAWDISRGDPNVRIGVLDTGLDYLHPEFEGQIAINSLEDLNGNGTFEPWSNTLTRNGKTGDFNGIDEDGNGFVDDVIGYDFTDQPRSPFGGDYLLEDPNPFDDNSHGTVVSGIIHARADNQLGGAGLAPDCDLVVLRAFAANGAGEDDDIARAIIYAADNDIQILNFSFGDIYPSLMMHEAIRYAYAKGVVMISSAGNGTGDELHYPSGFNEVISVSASAADLSNGNEYLWPLSSFGVTVDLCAPGTGIFTTTLQDTANDGTVTAYGRFNGTSTSAPMVTAAVGLLFAHKGYHSPQQVRGILTSTTDDIGQKGWDHTTGAGRLNLEKALLSVGSSNVQILSPENDGGSALDSIPIIGTVIDPEFLRYHLEWQTSVEDTSQWNTIIADQPYQIKADTLGWWDLRNLPEGDYTLRIRLEKTNGFTAEDRIRFVRDTTPAQIEISRATQIWDNHERKVFVVFRSDDQGLHKFHFRLAGSPTYQEISFDRTTRNGEFMLGNDKLSSGTYECFVSTQNLAGLTSQSATFNLQYQAEYINRSGYNVLDYTLPMGRLLNQAYDFDEDQLPEVVMSEYDQRLSFGPMTTYEFVGNQFVRVDSNTTRPILIPKDVGDSDNDGLLEILASVNDTLFLLEAETAGAFPDQILYSNEGNGLYAAALRNTDADPESELIVKDFTDYLILNGSGGAFPDSVRLPDISGNYEGSISPRVLVNDFDEDGKTEVIYGDFDGDFLVYEHRNGNNYENTWIDTTDLSKAGTYLTEGDFDGDGKPEFFVAVHTSPLRNADFEYDSPFWWLRIFEADGNDSYVAVWEDYLYDLDTENYNAATAGNIDSDPADELVFTTFPRTYVIEYSGNQYKMSWFLYGSLATHHVIADFNGNGIAEIGIGLGDSTFFFEKDVFYTGPTPVTSLRGKVMGPNEVRLDWPGSANATAYNVWQVKDPLNNDTALVTGPVSGTTFQANNLVEGEQYLFVLRSVNPGLNPTESGFGNAILLLPHPRPTVDSVLVVGDRQLEVWFSWPVVDRDADKSLFRLNDEQTPMAIIGGGDSKRLVLSFKEPFASGWNTLTVDTTFQDADRACLDPNTQPLNFFYEPVEEDFLYLTQWEIAGDKEGILYFNYPLDETTALDTANYRLSPVGEVAAVEWASPDMEAVKVRISTAKFGALGYPLSIEVENLCAINEVCLGQEGNVATFSAHKEDLSEAYAYPNPVVKHEVFEGMRFANLTQTATIRIYTVSGRLVNEIEETDGDGGLTWNMLDQGNNRIVPGIYIYHIWTDIEGVADFVGKFSVVE
jgi:hypothetical protein